MPNPNVLYTHYPSPLLTSRPKVDILTNNDLTFDPRASAQQSMTFQRTFTREPTPKTIVAADTYQESDLEAVRTGYIWLEPNSVEKFLMDNVLVISILVDLPKVAIAYFKDATFALDTIEMNERADSRQLVVLVYTGLPTQAALESMDALRDAWWTDVTWAQRRRMIITSSAK